MLTRVSRRAYCYQKYIEGGAWVLEDPKMPSIINTQ